MLAKYILRLDDASQHMNEEKWQQIEDILISIENILKYNNLDYSNVEIVSNNYIWDET